jgi:hypothetical protein
MVIYMKDNAIIIFTRFPSINKVKTRLSKNLDSNLVLEIHKAMIKDTINVCKNDFADVILFITEYEKLNDNTREFFSFENKIYPQGDFSFGEKMKNAFKKTFEIGYKKVILIGTDIPTLRKEDINFALKSLDNYDVCIHKTFDKGYYLIGLKNIVDEFFDENIFKGENVFENTVEIFKKQNLSYSTGRILMDIDERSDLEFYVKNEMQYSEYSNLNKLLREFYNEK